MDYLVKRMKHVFWIVLDKNQKTNQYIGSKSELRSTK